MLPHAQPNTITPIEPVTSISNLEGTEGRTPALEVKPAPLEEQEPLREQVSSIAPAQGRVLNTNTGVIDKTGENNPNIRVDSEAAEVTTLADTMEQQFEEGVRTAHADGPK